MFNSGSYKKYIYIQLLQGIYRTYHFIDGRNDIGNVFLVNHNLQFCLLLKSYKHETYFNAQPEYQNRLVKSVRNWLFQHIILLGAHPCLSLNFFSFSVSKLLRPFLFIKRVHRKNRENLITYYVDTREYYLKLKKTAQNYNYSYIFD